MRQLWNPISVLERRMFCNSEVIITSDSAAMLILTVDKMSPIVALGQMFLS